ncbi:hypothetical protein AV530_011775 [Patagioenas fasciata monilis]|uniref:Uncharacterized protein n=1 Tax=Patagioenas fasciata monilis TaxID=372326 RepID=A0A1V4KLS5_PATFA|nr:hypothetical protein AV530_011775 [Patagioenas fasciata monilis]
MSVLLQRTEVRVLELLPGEGDIRNKTLINRELGYSSFLCKHEKCEAETQITSCLRKLTVALKENFLKVMSFKVLACLWSGYISHLKYNISPLSQTRHRISEWTITQILKLRVFIWAAVKERNYHSRSLTQDQRKLE